MKIAGVPASRGSAVGPAVVHVATLPELPVSAGRQPEAEVERFDESVSAVMDRLAELEERAASSGAEESEGIFSAHRAFLMDPSFVGAARERIRHEGESAETATDTVAAALIERFEAIDDEYFAARAADIADLANQLIRDLLGLGPATLAHLAEPSVIVAADLTPSETVTIPDGMALAIVTHLGSATSHSAILARGLGIPAVAGVPDEVIEDGVLLGVDGSTGEVWIGPDDETQQRLLANAAELAAERRAAQRSAFAEAVTTDGRAVEVAANIGNVADAERAHKSGADGVGLFRTEFLFIDRGKQPDEEEQFEAYRAVFDVFGDRPIVVRTLDVGGDKDVPGVELAHELNPFLGCRGIRFCLKEREIFLTQLRALLRAASGRTLRLMFPMVASVEELLDAKRAVEEAAAQLRSQGQDLVSAFEIGVMIEVPSAAVTADLLAPHVDFFSIGTNDLTQYTLAVDRTNASVATMADAMHPAVLRLIRMVVEAAHANGKWVGLCGELAGDVTAAPILLGLGLDEWSVSAPQVAEVKSALRQLSFSECETLADDVLRLRSPDEVRSAVAGAVNAG